MRAGGQGGGSVWSEDRWRREEEALRRAVLAAGSEPGRWRRIARSSRRVMRSYTTGFFLVSRFLPRAKRDRVEILYAAVRYPDEVVDSFPLDAAARLERLDRWARDYPAALAAGSLREAVEQGVAPWLAGFAGIARRTGIPPPLYPAFLEAMRLDVRPRPFRDLEDLLDSYVYGSAIVVGAFLAHVYGPSAPGQMDRALEASRELGIGLQLTNFLRDVTEDARRGRLYLPLDWLAEAGVSRPDPLDPDQAPGLARAMGRMAREAEARYRAAEAGIDAFAPDSRAAIRACLEVYRRLNERIASSPRAPGRRESVPMREKWRALPASKYWRIPLAYGWPFP